jgi:V/A-type H+/Na+-transporting ATPase subunit I
MAIVFSAVPMLQVRTLILERDERSVLEGLSRLGAVQLIREEQGPDAFLSSPQDRTAELARCHRIRTRVAGVRSALERRPALALEGSRQEAMTLDLAEEQLSLMEERVAGPSRRRQQLMEHQRELTETCEHSSWFSGLDIPLDHEERFSFIHFVTGSLPLESYERLDRLVGENAFLFPLGEHDGRQSLVVVTTNRRETVTDSLLEKSGFRRDSLPDGAGQTVDGFCNEIQGELNELAVDLEAVKDDLKKVAVELEQPLRRIEAFADRECRLLEAARMFPRTGSTLQITGWIPGPAASTLEHRLEEITSNRYVLETASPDASWEARTPVLLRHSWLLRPFEALVATYGVPGYRELEPTFFVALSYVLMFGMMFGDVGHGLILATGGLFIAFAGSKKTRDFALLLAFAGSSSTVFGAIYGSFFGIQFFKQYAIWRDPLDADPIRLMSFAIGFGVILISLGLVLNVINRFRRGDILGAFLDKFGIAGMLFYWGTLAMLLNSTFLASNRLMGPSMALFLALPIVGWIAKEPLEQIVAHGRQGEASDGMTNAFIESLVGAFEAILSYLANTISFVRLAAYTMSHAALLAAAFMLAAQVRGSSVGGGLWAIIVIVLGNMVAIVLEGVIASVQALRLEYYEFFGKFFAGNGQPFQPFSLEESGQATPS